MLELAQQLSYYLSVVDGGATSKLVGLGQQLASISMVGNAARATIQSIIQPLNAMGTAWSQREQQLNNVARSLRQYQYVGQSVADINAEITRTMPGATQAQRSARFTEVYNQQFREARNAARGIFGEMTQLAAVLPGETNDYMMAFSQALPHLSRVRGMTDQRAMRLSSYLSAGAISAGIDSGQAARDLVQALTVGAHVTDRSWMEVWSQYARDPRTGRRISTTSDFNRLTIDQKVRVLEDIAAQLQPQMDAVGDSFEALMGTFNSARHEMYLAATEPIFDAWKKVIGATNGVLGSLMVPMSALGQVAARQLVPAFTWLENKIKSFGEGNVTNRFLAFAERLAFAQSRVHEFALGIQATAMAARSGLGRAWRTVSGIYGDKARTFLGGEGSGMHALASAAPMILMRILGVALGPVGWIITSVLTRMFLGGSGGSTLMAGGQGLLMVLSGLVNAGMTLYAAWNTIIDILATIAGALLPPLLTILASVLTNFLNLVAVVANMLLPVLLLMFMGTSAAATVVGIAFELLASWARVVALLFGGISSQGSDMVGTMRRWADAWSRTMTEFREAVYLFLEDLHLISGEERANALRQLHAEANTTPSWFNDLQQTIRDMQNQSNSARTGRAPPTRPQVHQDFRYSRFDITQQFAEGFDPDRVAAVFAGDLEALSEQRLQSGLLPAFTGP